MHLKWLDCVSKKAFCISTIQALNNLHPLLLDIQLFKAETKAFIDFISLTWVRIIFFFNYELILINFLIKWIWNKFLDDRLKVLKIFFTEICKLCFFIETDLPKAGITLSISLKSISCTTQLVATSRLLHFSTNWLFLMDTFCVKSLKFSGKCNR